MPDPALVLRAISNEFDFWCRDCYSPNEPGADKRRMAIRKTITMEWEHEYGDFGSVLATYPEFSVEPECPGPNVEWRNFLHEYSENKYILDCVTGIVGDEEIERDSTACPFHPYFDNYEHPSVVEIVAAWRERNQFAKLLNVRNLA